MKPSVAFLFAFVVFLPATLVRDLWSPDEQRHAEVARTMIVSGDWVLPHLEGEVYPDKPAPPFWAMAVSMKLFGVSEWAARLPFVLAVGGTLAAVAWLARLLSAGGGAALLSVLMLATAYRFAWLGQRVSLDALMTCFTTFALVGWVRQWRGLGSSGANGLLFFGASALAVSVKGPLGVLVPFVTALTHALWTRRTDRLLRFGFLAPVALFAAILAAWLVPSCLAGGEAYTRELLFKQSAGRVFHAWNHERAPWYYLTKLPVEFMPWTPVLMLGLWLAVRRRLSSPDFGESVMDMVRLTMSWFGPMFVFLSIVQSKRGSYLLPLYPALALFSGVVAARIAAGAGDVLPLRRIAKGLAALLAVIGVAVAAAPFVVDVEGLARADVLPGALAFAAVMLGGAALATKAARRGELQRALVRVAAAVALVIPIAGLLVLPVVDGLKSPRALALTLAREAAGRPQFVPFLGVHTEEYRFYSGLDCRRIDRDMFQLRVDDPSVAFAVMEAKDMKRVELPPGAEVIERRMVSSEDVVLLRLRREVHEPPDGSVNGLRR